MLKNLVANLKDQSVKVSDTFTATMTASASMLELVKERSTKVTEVFLASQMNANLTADTVKANLKTYSDRMATIIDHVRHGYDRDDLSTDIPDALFDSDDDDFVDDSNANHHQPFLARHRRAYFSDEDDEDAFLKRLKWPVLSESQVDAILGRLDELKETDSVNEGNAVVLRKRTSRAILKVVEIPADDDVNHNREKIHSNAASSSGWASNATVPEPANHSLQICFMNELALDSDDDEVETPSKAKSLPAIPTAPTVCEPEVEDDFWRKQARLQAEARVALAQASHMARMRIEADKYRKKNAPLSEMISLPRSCYGHRRLNQKVLSKLTVAELDSVNTSLAMEIQRLNEELVTSLMKRDELYMGQDSMLVDLEDVTRHLNSKEDVLRQRVVQPPVKRTSAASLMAKASSIRLRDIRGFVNL